MPAHEPPSRGLALACLAVSLGAGSATPRLLSVSISTVPTQYCVLGTNGVSSPTTFEVDASTGYIYLTLPTVASLNFANISEIYATIGAGTYGAAIANVRGSLRYRGVEGSICWFIESCN